MKKIIRILFLAIVVAFQSCVDNSSTFPEDADGVFYGNLNVDDYTERVGISVTENPGSTVDIFFDNVKFAKGMPVRIDITVKGLASQETDDLLSFSAVDVDPYINKEQNPQPAYRFSEISGTVKDKELVLSAKMSDDLGGTRAGKKFSFRGMCK